MMRKVQFCPKCDDEILVLIIDKAWSRLFCRECGWGYTFMPPPAKAELDAAIAEAVAKVRGQVGNA